MIDGGGAAVSPPSAAVDTASIGLLIGKEIAAKMSVIAEYVYAFLRVPARAFRDEFVLPGGELFVALLVPQVVALVGVRFVQRRRHLAVWPSFFPKSAVRRRSSIVDVVLFILSNGLPMGTLALLTKPTSQLVARFLPSPAVGARLFAAEPNVALAFGTLATLLALDFGLFVTHWLHHKIPPLWAFHAVHHSAPEMTPLSASRVHPAEFFANRLISSVTAGLLLGVWRAAVQPQLTAATILGTHLAFFVFQAWFASARHSSVPISFGPLERMFVSPRMHQLHHSTDPAHYDRNFGTILSVWDAMFGFQLRQFPHEGVRFGVNGMDGDSLSDTLFRPCVRAVRSVSVLRHSVVTRPVRWIKAGREPRDLVGRSNTPQTLSIVARDDPR